MTRIIDITPFEALRNKIPVHRPMDSDEVLGLNDSDLSEARYILDRLIGRIGISDKPESAAPCYGTYPQCLRVAKRIAAETLVEVPVIGNAFNTHQDITVNAETDIEPVWQNALQQDQQTYYWALQQYQSHKDEEGWEWAKDYADRVLESLDRYYDLSNNMEGLFGPGTEPSQT